MLYRRRHGVRIFAYYLGELAVLSLLFFVTYWLRQRTSALWGMELSPLLKYLWLWPVSLAVWSAFLWGFNAYRGFRSRTISAHGFGAGVVSALGVLALFAILTILKEHTINRSFVGLLGVVSFLGLFSVRVAGAAFLSHYTRKGYDRHYVLIGGTHAEAVALAQALESIRGGIYQVRGFVSEEGSEPDRPLDRWKVLGSYEDIPRLAKIEPVDEVYLLPQTGTLEGCREIVERCELMGIMVHLRLAPFERVISRLSVGEVAGAEYLTFSTAPRSGMMLSVKRLIDVTGALGMLALLSPALLLVGLLVRLTSRGPAVFRQDRAGMNGRTFTLYKFRTMVEGAEQGRFTLESRNEMDGPAFKIKSDPRITRLGRFLRKNSIDELPQLLNVLKGDMSLVGPRPLPMYEVEKFDSWHRRRMTMRPGITCLWQVMGRNRVTNFAEWMKLDLEYVDRWSLGLDFKILARTIPAVVVGRGAF